jgi:hypothetical protein
VLDLHMLGVNYSHKKVSNKMSINNYLINTINRATHRATRGHELIPVPYPRLIGSPMGKTHGRSRRPKPCPLGSGAHGRTYPWVELPGLRGLRSSLCVRRFETPLCINYCRMIWWSTYRGFDATPTSFHLICLKTCQIICLFC